MGVAKAAALATAVSYSRVLGANDRIRVGHIGLGVRGAQLFKEFRQSNGTEIAALCDIYDVRLRKAQESAPEATAYADFRKLVEQKNLDVVVIATPDFWHAPMAIAALNAGKDVYVEKPLTFRMEEGPAIVKAARANQRICGVGTQQRSGAHYMRARDEYIQTGKLGKIGLVRTFWHDGGASNKGGGHATPPEALNGKPEGLDWAAFLGPLKWREWNDRQYFDFRSYLELSTGVLGDKFVHWIDAVHMMMQQDAPLAASFTGGIYRFHDGRTAPDTINLGVEYRGDWLATFEHGCISVPVKEGIEICGGDGRLFITRQQLEYYTSDKTVPPVIIKAEGDLTTAHVQNFLASVRTRRPPNCDVQAGHRSAQVAHLGNLSYEQRRRVRFDPDREVVLPA
jgi:predicted dehydrogenase